MKFHIKKLIIWRNGETGEKREVNFLSDKVNIITGASQTGKSAIIHIIDYCLGSDKCPVPAGVVRENASWYGLLIECQEKQYLLARRNSDTADEGANDYSISECPDGKIPEFLKATHTISDAKELLNDLAHMPTSGHDETGWATSRLTFRDVMSLVFQYQGTVANQYELFGKMHDVAHRKQLEVWIDFILGAETMSLIKNRMEMLVKKREQKALEKDYAVAKEQLSEWMADLHGQLVLAKNCGLLQDVEEIPDDIPGIINCATEVVENRRSIPVATWKNLQEVIDQITAYEKNEERLAVELAKIDKRLAALQRFQTSLAIFDDGQKLKREHLNIHTWFEDNWVEGEHLCPFCGSTAHTRMTKEMAKLGEEIKKCESKVKNAPPIKDLYLREQESLRREHDRVAAELQTLRDQLEASRGMMSEYKQKSKDMYMILGEMKATVQLDRKLATNNEVVAKLLALDGEIRALSEKIKSDTEKYREDISKIWSAICDRTLYYLKQTKVEERYKTVAPEFSKSDMLLLVNDANGEQHSMSVLGSGSNWVGYHVAFMAAFHEYLFRKQDSIVPSFCVFDQPSQVHGADQPQDVEAVKALISTMADGVKNTKCHWQVILIEHATEGTYAGIDGAEEIENWWEGEKLIPVDWVKHEEK